ncbi:M48 family metallopeptidase [Novosphingopyxis sp. YJ-S2-01]|uniref:M48 family metallopeptidase n=1 Tax=Novosphingopyxis sp. YJ-S2-01 TaxID=2794021 RepID=UPI0018DB1641|nr:SprT family zinc-dependent metalloprotease [Novosphingopyxis sp. YJ-S2-01]MBH9536648.1 M48 family metallopeptidase [Novosphingopyxis sp. YJ-S2-01]
MFWKTEPRDPQVEVAGRIYPVRIKRLPQARRMSLRADPVRGEVKVTGPTRLRTAEALAFARSRQRWLAERFAAAADPVRLMPGQSIGFCGEPVEIVHDAGLARGVRMENDRLLVGGPADHAAARVERWLRGQARTLMTADLAFYCARAGQEEPKLSIGDARSRWGSCSSRGHIRLGWRLVMAPAMVRRSVVAHEVAHLVHMDHSPRFYALLDEIFEGDRKACDAWLKAHGTGLHMIGAAAGRSADDQ